MCVQSGLIKYKQMNKNQTHTHAVVETSYVPAVPVNRLRNIDDGAPDPEERRVGRCDREFLPSAKCIISLFVMEQTEPKITVVLSAESWSALNKLSEPSVRAPQARTDEYGRRMRESQEATAVFLLLVKKKKKIMLQDA